MSKFTKEVTKEEFINKCKDNGWVTDAQEMYLSELYTYADHEPYDALDDYVERFYKTVCWDIEKRRSFQFNTINRGIDEDIYQGGRFENMKAFAGTFTDELNSQEKLDEAQKARFGEIRYISEEQEKKAAELKKAEEAAKKAEKEAKESEAKAKEVEAKAKARKAAQEKIQQDNEQREKNSRAFDAAGKYPNKEEFISKATQNGWIVRGDHDTLESLWQTARENNDQAMFDILDKVLSTDISDHAERSRLLTEIKETAQKEINDGKLIFDAFFGRDLFVKYVIKQIKPDPTEKDWERARKDQEADRIEKEFKEHEANFVPKMMENGWKEEDKELLEAVYSIYKLGRLRDLDNKVRSELEAELNAFLNTKIDTNDPVASKKALVNSLLAGKGKISKIYTKEVKKATQTIEKKMKNLENPTVVIKNRLDGIDKEEKAKEEAKAEEGLKAQEEVKAEEEPKVEEEPKAVEEPKVVEEPKAQEDFKAEEEPKAEEVPGIIEEPAANAPEKKNEDLSTFEKMSNAMFDRQELVKMIERRCNDMLKKMDKRKKSPELKRDYIDDYILGIYMADQLKKGNIASVYLPRKLADFRDVIRTEITSKISEKDLMKPGLSQMISKHARSKAESLSKLEHKADDKKRVGYSVYLRKHTGKYAGETDKERIDSLAKAMAAQVLYRNGIPFKLKDIHSTADYIKKVYNLEELEKTPEDLTAALKNADSVSKFGRGRRSSLYAVMFPARFRDYTREMASLRDNMIDPASHSKEYRAVFEGVNDMARLELYLDAGLSNEELEEKFIAKGINLMDSVMKYTKGREKEMKDPERRACFQNALDALAIMGKFTWGTREISERLIQEINMVRNRGQKDAANYLDPDVVDREYGAMRATTMRQDNEDLRFVDARKYQMQQPIINV